MAVAAPKAGAGVVPKPMVPGLAPKRPPPAVDVAVVCGKPKLALVVVVPNAGFAAPKIPPAAWRGKRQNKTSLAQETILSQKSRVEIMRVNGNKFPYQRNDWNVSVPELKIRASFVYVAATWR